MIPFAILSGNFIFQGEIRSEFSIQDLSVDGFTFRLPEPFAGGQMPDAFLLHFLHFSKSCYQDLLLTDFTIAVEESEEEFYQETNYAKTTYDNNRRPGSGYPASIHKDREEILPSSVFSYCTCYRVITESADFFSLALALQKEYRNYIDLKLNLSQAEVSQKLTGYPAQEESLFATSWKTQKTSLMASLHPDPGWQNLKLPPCAFSLDCPAAWNAYLSQDLSDYVTGFFREQGLPTHPIASCKPAFLYIGNQFCPHLFPDHTILRRLLGKAASEGLTPVLVLAPASESLLPRCETLLNECCRLFEDLPEKYTCSTSPEIVVNDWGTLQVIRTRNQQGRFPFKVILGTLLQKRKKDPRIRYSISTKNDALADQSHLWDADFYKEHLLTEYPLSGALFETCGYSYPMPSFPAKSSGGSIHKDLLLPFYQTNTATACTLRAAAAWGNRGRQLPDGPCPRYCEQQSFLYPGFLEMTGHYNSLFGFDRRCLEDSRYMASYLSQGIDRLVLQFL